METKRIKIVPNTLLHKLNASCGRPLVGLLLGGLMFSFASCHKEAAKIDYTARMNEFYLESRGLIETSADSTFNFTKKFAHFVINHKGSETNEFYQPTVHNISAASDKFGCDFDSTNLVVWIITPKWEGTDTISF